MRRPLLGILLLASAFWAPCVSAAFDQDHRAWDALLKQNVVVAHSGSSSTVRYANLARQRADLEGYLATLSAVTPSEFAAWPKPQRLAFLINAYNAFTVELILTRYPDIKSIKDLGTFLQSPWRKRFFRLLGEERSLDDIEQGMIRAPGAFDDPRIHFAVVCASIGCPMLRNEAYVASRLDAQLDDAGRRFLSDRARNRFEPQARRMAVSRIFDWYGKDFERSGHEGESLQAFLIRNADVLGDTPSAREQIRAGQFSISYLEYDWSLNDAR